MPNSDQSFVPQEKITGYLLSETHEIGKHKAAFFSGLGFDFENVDEFMEALIQHSVDRDIEKTSNSPFGNKYQLKCEFQTPDSRNPCIITVWIIENGQEFPKLVTAYPAD